jgi:hypothetical protein
MKYQFKHEYWGDEWQDFGKAFDAEQAAERIAEEHWLDDPYDDVEDFSFKVEIKDEQEVITKFVVTAYTNVEFRAEEK